MSQTTVKGHPFGLFILFFTEMWERFSYYGMRSLLMYYMIKQLMFAQGKASQIYGLYTAFIYFTPLLGGWLADRVLGQKRTVILGGVLMAIGHFLMAFESLFFPALLFLILGNGAFKPNISAQVGTLYSSGDERRDRGYSIFYVGINLGAFLSPLVCGTLGEVYGWHYGFGIAGVGMLVGLFIYLAGQKYLTASPGAQTPKQQQECPTALSADDRNRILAFIILCVFNVMFRISYEQQGNTLALWADMHSDRHLFGPGSWEIKASWFQSVNPALIFILTPLITSLWSRQASRGREPSSVAKMAIGCILVGLSFLIMIPAAQIAAVHGTSSIWWLIGCMVVLTAGELYISPVGLSLVTKLAPPSHGVAPDGGMVSPAFRWQLPVRLGRNSLEQDSEGTFLHPASAVFIQFWNRHVPAAQTFEEDARIQ